MYLFIDNSSPGLISFFCYLNTKWVQVDFVSLTAGDLLINLDKLLKKMGQNKVDLRGLEVRVGKGSFTSTRVAVTLVNTLAWSLGIPVVAIAEDGPTDLEVLIKNTPVGQYVSAKYSGQVKIGQPKR